MYVLLVAKAPFYIQGKRDHLSRKVQWLLSASATIIKNDIVDGCIVDMLARHAVTTIW